MKDGENSRLRSSTNAKAYEAPQEQEPAVDWREGTQQAVEKGPTHTNSQTLSTQKHIQKMYEAMHRNN